jgi:N-acetylated-alpha-linked acidic dipeptidase
MIKSHKPGVALATLLLVAAPLCGAQSASLTGFRSSSVEEQLDVEARFDALLNKDNLRDWMRQMTRRPHNLGSPQAKTNAEMIAALFTSWGFDTEIETFHVLFPTPKVRELEVLGERPFTASLTEELLPSDSAHDTLAAEGLPPFNAYSADGEVRAELVFINRGVPEDYEELERRGISVKGKIAIARYGGSWRGIKPKVAAEHGAIGCILFNDPQDDGFAQGDPYPDGAYKHKTAVQRGSVVDLPLRPGDPLTPGYGATQYAKRLKAKDAETIMKIPVLPISYADAMPLLKSMAGPVAPSAWRGGMPITYRFGGEGSAIVRMKTEFNWDIVPCYNVIAKMEGSTDPDEWIIRGNHHDAWVIGATDPASGMVAVMEEARAIGALAKAGWRPKRTLVYTAWDGEEPGLLGSVEWAEHHQTELQEKAVAYINTDGNSRGFLSIGGSHSLEKMAAEIAHAVTDPQTGVSVSERARARRLVRGSFEERAAAKSSRDMRLAALGSGSDYSAFLQHLGIASFNVRFGGEGVGGEYHTSFDTFDHYTRFKDPNFDYGIALIQVCGRLTLRLAQADVLPFDFTRAASTIQGYADSVVKLADTMRTETKDLNANIEAGRFKLAADPTETFVPPTTKDPVPFTNFAPLFNAIIKFKSSAEAYEAQLQEHLESGRELSEEKRHRLNRALYQAERAFLSDEGLPRRPWFRHQIYAPGFYTGYGVKTLPGVREGLEERRWTEAAEQTLRTAKSIEKYAAQIDTARKTLDTGK